jgi:hypothetical protein
MSVYPLMASGARFQKPFTVESSFLHVTNEMPSGPRFSYSKRTDPLHKWTLTYSALTDADLATIEAFFESMNGRYGVFTFTDERLTAYTNCRFDQDALEVHYVGPNQSTLQVTICEVGYC